MKNTHLGWIATPYCKKVSVAHIFKLEEGREEERYHTSRILSKEPVKEESRK